MTMHESPRIRRMRNDRLALERLATESSVFRFTTQGYPPNHYQITFHGTGLYRHNTKVKVHDTHRVEIKLGSSYPRTIPEIRWLTPIYHPNISEIGMVCLGGYGTHWVPSVQLDELCVMLWDMLRYHNYDIRSPYNRDAALWVASQTTFLFPTDPRALRDRRVALGRIEDSPAAEPGHSTSAARTNKPTAPPLQSATSAVASKAARVREFIGKRYGRVFGEFLQEMPDGEDTTPEPATPRSSDLQELTAAQARAARAVADQPRSTTDELLILDPGPVPVVTERRPHIAPSDEIRFIE
jgi:ubiquitin-protein ligase